MTDYFKQENPQSKKKKRLQRTKRKIFSMNLEDWIRLEKNLDEHLSDPTHPMSTNSLFRTDLGSFMK